MNNELQEILSVVEELNSLYSSEDETPIFSLVSVGWCTGIKFFGEVVWSTESDYRDMDDNEEYEPLLPYIIKRLGSMGITLKAREIA